MDGIQTILADYDFPVEVMPLVAFKEYQDGWKIKNYDVPPTMQKAIVRTDTDDVLGTHGAGYQMVKHADIVDRMENAATMACTSTDYTHTQKLYENGAKMKGTIAFNDLVIEPQVGDYIRFHIDYLNSYDGQWSIMIKAQGHRLWCANGCANPHSLSYDRSKHTTGFSLEGTSAKIRNAIQGFWDSKGIWQDYATKELPIGAAEIFFKATLCRRSTNTSEVKINERKLENLMGLYHKETRSLGQNKWALYNALTHWASHPTEANNPHRAEVLRHNEITKAMQSSRWDGLGVTDVKELA